MRRIDPPPFERIPAVNGRCIVRLCDSMATHRRLTVESSFSLPYCGEHFHDAETFFGATGRREERAA